MIYIYNILYFIIYILFLYIIYTIYTILCFLIHTVRICVKYAIEEFDLAKNITGIVTDNAVANCR